MKAPRITVDELRKKMESKEPFTVLDVRNSVDYGISGFKITGAVRIPLDELAGRIRELDPAREVVAYCT